MSMEQIKELRARTGAGILDCKKALGESNDQIEPAIEWLRAKGISKAVKKASRAATEGTVYSYIHAGGKIGVLLEINCETDFVALTDDFQTLVKDIAMHIAAAGPEYISADEIPAEVVEKERAIQKARAMEEGKPEAIAEKMVDGRVTRFFEELCLLEQKFVKDDKITVGSMLAAAVAKIGENIKVRRFARYVLGEGLEKRVDNFEAEVAAMAGMA